MRAIVVDDEPELRVELVRMLNELWPELNVVAEAGDGLSAITMIQEYQPDIAFLDIQMPGKSGLEVVKEISGLCRVVFVTAFDHYAVEAFEREAVDYLLKPVSQPRMIQAIERIKKALQNPVPDFNIQLQQLASELIKQKQYESLKWVRASKGESTHLINIDDVLFFHAEDKYTTVATTDGEFLIRKPIKELEEELNPEQFWRIHRSTIVNVSKIASSHRDISGAYVVKLTGSSRKLKVSRNYTYLFKQM
jgi:DNA-binding LytR/AlgR family response regulator